MGKKKNFMKNNYAFIDSSILNNKTFIDYFERLKKIALSIFEWVNLPSSMNARYLEETLFYDGQASLLKDNRYGCINTKCCSDGNINIYGLPTRLNCYSYTYQEPRLLYTGINNQVNQDNSCILVQNTWGRIPTCATLDLFAYRLYEAERTCDVNIKAQKTPVLLLTDENQRLTMENMYSQIDGNRPAIFGDKNNLSTDQIRAIKTDAPFVADKVMEYKKEIWNEALTFLGINNIQLEKKERLIADEANSNNELINLNLQSYLAPRQEACKQFNELFNLTDNNAISVRVRSDLHNIIKNTQSIVTDNPLTDDIQFLDTNKEMEVN